MILKNFWDYRYLGRIDFRMALVIFALMMAGLLVIASHTVEKVDHNTAIGISSSLGEPFFTPMVIQQIERLLAGVVIFCFFVGFDYNRLREWTWILYILVLFALIGVFFTNSIQGVHRWYRIPLLGISIQPSEYAKLTVVMALSWFLEKSQGKSGSLSTACFASLILAIPFFLILRQPDLGTALIVASIALVIFYFGGVHPYVIRLMSISGALALLLIALIFLGAIPHESIRPWATKVLKEYQFDRLDPNTHHQKAAVTAIALGGVTGKGWRNGDYTQGGWLPTPYTDSVFSAFGEEFGLIGLIVLLLLFYALIYFSFQVCAVAPNLFGRFLAAGIAAFIAAHLIVNVGMMTGLLPITGVPLVLITYGGSSVLLTMAALGILQSIYSRRFMF